MKFSTIAALFGVILMASATASDACTRSVSQRAASTTVPAAGIDQQLLSEAIRAEVNYHRCRVGLKPVGDGGQALARAAGDHSHYMAKKKKLTHFSNVPGKKSLGERVQSSGLFYRAAAENLVMVHRYQVDNRRFKTVNRRECVFAANGKAIPAHSYASMARHAVDMWMASPAHRQNMLSPKVDRTSLGVAYTPNTKYCGQVWLTQKLIG